jgi:sortase B
LKKVIDKLLTIAIVVCIGLLIYSGLNIFLWSKSNNEIDDQVSEVQDIADVKDVEDSEKVEMVNPAPKKSDPYWDYIKIKLINVDFTKLKEINSETVGWIQVGGTNINYPFVQAGDNKFYLIHQFNKKYNTAGWVFMDYRNNKAEYDKNTILYAHGRLNKTMFGSLRNVVKKDWYNNTDNYIVKLSTEYENTLWQVFSTYQIKTTNDYLDISFDSDEEYLDFLNMLKNRSVHNYNVELTPQDKIITLSTCHNDTDKIVLHAKLIKREKK